MRVLVCVCVHVDMGRGVQGEDTVIQSPLILVQNLKSYTWQPLEILKKEKYSGNSFSICMKDRLEQGEAAKPVLVIQEKERKDW